MTDKMNKVYLIPIFYWLLAGLLPALTLLIEFSNVGQGFNFLCISVYSHLFIYPLLFGYLFVAFLIKPVQFLINSSIYRQNRKILNFFVVFILLFLFFGIELQENPAIWEISPNALSQNPELVNFFIDPSASNSGPNLASTYGQQLKGILVGVGNWSITRWTYFLSFNIQFLSIIFAFLSFSGFVVIGISLPENRRQEYRQAASNLVFSFLFGLLWFLMRLVYEKERAILYDSSKAPGVSIIIGVLYVISVVYIVASLWKRFGQYFEAIFGAIGGIFVVGSILNPDILASLFGRNATFQTYLALLVACWAVLLPWFLHWKNENYQKILFLAQEERSDVTADDLFEVHGLSDLQEASIAAQIKAYPQVREAYLVRKTLQYIPDKPLYVLGILQSRMFMEAESKIRERLLSELVLPDQTLIVILDRNRAMAEVFKQISSRAIYQEK